jgi:uncharacterized protein
MIPELAGENVNPGEINTARSGPDDSPGYSRNLSLDVLRGIALLLALFVSIWVFGGFSTTQQNGLLVHSKGGNYRLWGAVELLLDGKMRALISIVFGAGVVIFLSRANKVNKVPVPDLYIRRQMWLMAFGLVNAMLFLWPVDILFHLGMIGILLFPFVRLSPRKLLLAATLATLIFCAKNYWNYSDNRGAYAKYTAVVKFEKKLSNDSLLAAQKKLPLKNQKKDSLSAKQREEKAAWEGIAKSNTYDPKQKDETAKKIRNPSYAKIWDHILPMTQNREASWTYQSGIWDIAGMMLLGMALFKWRFFGVDFSRTKYLAIALTGITAGLLLGWFRLQFHHYALQDYTKYVINNRIPYNLFFPLERALLATGYAGLVLWLIRSRFFKAAWLALAKIGQMALTNYLLQSILCTIFFTGVGMGYYGRLQQYQLYLFVAELCIVQLVFSITWLRYFKYGPAEWLLRCLVYWKWLPNKIISATPLTPASPLSLDL